MKSQIKSTSTSDLYWPTDAALAPPGDGEVRVWCSLLRGTPQVLKSSRHLLSTEELNRSSRFHGEPLRHQFVMSRIVLRTILGRCLGVAPQTLEFGSDDRGKPYLMHGAGLQFNLAHTADFMVLAVARKIVLGVDVERIRRLKDALAIASRFYSPEEANWLKSRSPDELDQAFFSLWTRKEAVLKATGEGISSGIASIELLSKDGAFRQTVSRSTDTNRNTTWNLHELQPAAGFVGALALPTDHGRLQIRATSFHVG